MSTTKVTDNLRETTEVDAAKITTGTIPEARITSLDATKLTGTVADARFPATLPASSGANLTALPAGNLTGTVADARLSTVTSSKLSGNLPAISGASLTSLNASNLGSGTVPTARLGSGTASSSTFLQGNNTWATPSGGNWTVKHAGSTSTATSLTFTISGNVRFLLSMEDVPSGGGTLEMRLFHSGTERTSGYTYLINEITTANTGTRVTNHSHLICGHVGGFHCVDILMPSVSAHYTHVQHYGSRPEDGTYPRWVYGTGNYNTAETHNQFKVQMSNGNAFTGTYQVLELNDS